MAVGIMKEAGKIKDSIPKGAAFLDVLSLDGVIRPVDGMLPANVAARKEGVDILYLPPIHGIPLTHIEGLELRYVETLQEVIDSFSGQLTTTSITSPTSSEPSTNQTPNYDKDFKHVLGHQQVKRALEIAAAGGP